MEKKNLDWSNLTFSYQKTDKRFVANYTNGAWDEGALIDDDMIVMSEDAGVLQYAQTVFEGLKAYTTEDGHIVCFRPDLNASRLLAYSHGTYFGLGKKLGTFGYSVRKTKGGRPKRKK